MTNSTYPVDVTLLPNRLELKCEDESVPLDQNIFYKLLRYQNGRHRYSYEETGIGEFRKNADGDIIFTRETVFTRITEGKSKRSHSGKAVRLDKNFSYILTPSTPVDYRDLLSSKDSVLCSTDPYVATPVELENNTLLGKMQDRIQSIDIDELWTLLTAYNPDLPEMPAIGSIRYNTVEGCFEGYDGDRWRALMWGEK